MEILIGAKWMICLSIFSKKNPEKNINKRTELNPISSFETKEMTSQPYLYGCAWIHHHSSQFKFDDRGFLSQNHMQKKRGKDSSYTF
jgi:hypothetical protein